MTESIATILAALGIASLVLALITMASGRHRPALALSVLGLAAVSFVSVWRAFLVPHVAELKQTIAQRDKQVGTLTIALGDAKQQTIRVRLHTG